MLQLASCVRYSSQKMTEPASATEAPSVSVCDQLGDVMGDVMGEEESRAMFRTFSDPGM